jgi:hypothetical protein
MVLNLLVQNFLVFQFTFLHSLHPPQNCFINIQQFTLETMKGRLLGKKNKRYYYSKDGVTTSSIKNIWERPKKNKTDRVRCVLCRGVKLLCGKTQCPVILKTYSKVRTQSLINSTSLDGASPPSVFIGRMGYPKVDIGPMVPPMHGDTAYLDTPEFWEDININQLVQFRSNLVRGKFPVNISDVENSNKIVELTREMALASKSPEVELEFTKIPTGKVALNDVEQPHGPSAPITRFDVDNIKMDFRMEKAFYDIDLKAQPAVVDLFKNGVLVSQLQKAFSVGAFGIKGNRRFVPTRWSITAVDSTLGEYLMKFTRQNPWINEFRVYVNNHLDNRWVVLMIPAQWSYELIEAWYPNTTWNPDGLQVSIMGSSEGFNGRTTYAEIGGCYYAARLAVNEKLNNERRQASVVILREAHPGYILPVGVWNVRENVRKALKNPPNRFNTINGAFEFISNNLSIPIKKWIETSSILQDHLFQTKLEQFGMG